MRAAAVYHLAGRARQPALPAARARSGFPARAADPARRAKPRPALGRHDELPSGAAAIARNVPRRGQRQRGVSAQPSRQGREHHGAIAPAGRRSATSATPRAGRTTCSYAQPFERHHLQKHKWFSFAFNGQLANYAELRDKLLADDDHHLSRATDTEIIMHEISRELSGDRRPPLVEVMRNVAERFDGAYCLVLLNALGEMVIARDPWGFRPLCYAIEGPLLAAASESVALLNLGFSHESIRSLEPGHMITVERRRNQHRAVCRQPAAGPLLLRVDLLRERGQHAGRPQRVPGPQSRWARSWRGWKTCRSTRTRSSCRCPTRASAAADAMAYQLGVPSAEGLIRNRYAGRTFIEGTATAARTRPPPNTRRSAKCWKASACFWSKTRSSARRRCGC